ncbi:MAG TPA: zinc ribbon domain-containing protein [Rhodanobacteraceae bacterium]|nr:zinc ribbon domain-containing protein [Rhodanobacteraceae bacterium]
MGSGGPSSCARCGGVIPRDAAFCPKCGAALAAANGADATAQQASAAKTPGPTTPPQLQHLSGRKILVAVVKTLASVLLTILIGKLLEYIFPGLVHLYRAADAFVADGVRNGQPFHFYAEYFRHVRDLAFSTPNPNLGTLLGAVFLGFFGAIGQILHEGVAPTLTMLIVLVVGISATYDRKNEHPVLVAIIVGPLAGGCVLYVFELILFGFFKIFGEGARLLAIIGATVPIAKTAVVVWLDSRRDKFAESVVEQMSRKGGPHT